MASTGTGTSAGAGAGADVPVRQRELAASMRDVWRMLDNPTVDDVVPFALWQVRVRARACDASHGTLCLCPYDSRMSRPELGRWATRGLVWAINVTSYHAC